MHFLKLFSYLFHPIFMPFAGTAIYYVLSPGYFPEEARKSVIIPVFILTVVVPVVLYFLLKNIGWVRSHELSEVRERRIPLYIAIPLTYLIVTRITPTEFSVELHYFFTGILAALFACLLLVLLGVKASIHMMGISGLTVFIIGLSFHYQINIVWGIALLVLSIGAVASSRLYLKAHNIPEIIIGTLLGCIPQLMFFPHWI